MKALVLNEAGGPGQLKEAAIDMPEPKAHELRIKVHAVGLNPVDYKLMGSPLPEWSFPHVSGLDVSGVVDEVGADVTDWSVGDEVYYHGNMTENGGFAEFTTTRADVVSSVPKGLTHVEAASMPTSGFTAYQSLHRKALLRPGQTIMIQAGAGGVGSFAVQLAKHLGLTVISTCSRKMQTMSKAWAPITWWITAVRMLWRKYTNGRMAAALMWFLIWWDNRQPPKLWIISPSTVI